MHRKKRVQLLSVFVAIFFLIILVGSWAIAGEMSITTTGTVPVPKGTSSTRDDSNIGIQVITDVVASPTSGTVPVPKETPSTMDDSNIGIQVITDVVASPTTGTVPVDEKGHQ